MADKLFRYLEKYVGTYRVKCHYDETIGDFPRDDDGKIDESFDELYIPCSRAQSEIRHTYQPGVFVWYTEKISSGRKVRDELAAKRNKIWFEYEETDGDVLIWFKEEDLEEFAKIVQPKTTGKSIKPFSDKNLPAPVYEIPEADNKKLDKITSKMEKQDKMLFLRKIVADFDTVISKKKGKAYNLTKERSLSKLKPKVFIHYIGMWDEFVEFATKEAAKVK